MLHEGLSKFKEPGWDAVLETLKAKGSPYTLTLIDEISFPVAKQSMTDPRVDVQLMMLDALSKAIYARRPSGEATPEEVRGLLEIAAYTELKSHPLEDSFGLWLRTHLSGLASQPAVRKELEGIRDNYQCEFKVEPADDSSPTMQSLVPDSARKILSWAE